MCTGDMLQFEDIKTNSQVLHTLGELICHQAVAEELHLAGLEFTHTFSSTCL